MPAEYRRHAQRLDRSVHGVPEADQAAGRRGPIEALLRDTPVTGFVVGTFCEASRSVHEHLEVVATCAAQRCWRRIGAGSYAEARSYFVTTLYRNWGAVFARANARLRLSRLEAVGAFGRRVRARPDADGVADGLGAPGLFDERRADVGGAGGPGPGWGA